MQEFFPPLKKHIFVCENNRDPNDPKSSCAAKGSLEITARLKKLCHEAGLKGRVRVNKAGCLGQCAAGVVVVIYPEGIWLQDVTLEDAEQIFKQYIAEV